MKIIVLYGIGGIGKTTCIKKLYGKILADGGVVIDGKTAIKEIDYVIRYQGKTIGITSRGDNAECLKKPFALFQKHNCEICITASRSNRSKACVSGAMNFIEEFAKNNSAKIIRYKKAYITADGNAYNPAYEINAINEIQSDMLLNEVKRP